MTEEPGAPEGHIREDWGAAEREAEGVSKHEIASKLHAVRAAQGLTQDEVATAAGMTQSMVARLEATSGPLPSLKSIQRYVDACGGHFALIISTEKVLDEDPFKDAFEKSRGRISTDFDLGIE